MSGQKSEITIERSEFHKKFGICKLENIYGFKKISYNPETVANSLGDSRKKLNKLLADQPTGHGKYIIIRYFEQGRWDKKTEKKEKPGLPLKQYAVFGYPDKNAYFAKARDNKVYYWGIVGGVDRNDAYSKLKFNNYWYHTLSRDLFFYELKDGKLVKNYFPGTPILDPYEPNYKGGTISGVKIKPLKEILPGELHAKHS